MIILRLFYFSTKTCCGSSLEPSHRDSSNDRLQHTSLWRKWGKLSLDYPCYPFLSGTLAVHLGLDYRSHALRKNAPYSEL